MWLSICGFGMIIGTHPHLSEALGSSSQTWFVILNLIRHPELDSSSWTRFRTDENTLKLSTLRHTSGSRIKSGMTNTESLTWKRMCPSFIVHYALLNEVRRKPIVNYSLFIIHYALRNAVRRKPIMHYALLNEVRRKPIVNYALCIMHCELWIINALYNVRACVCVWGVLNHLNPFYGEKRRFTVKKRCFTAGKRRFSMRKAAVLISNITNVGRIRLSWIKFRMTCQARNWKSPKGNDN